MTEISGRIIPKWVVALLRNLQLWAIAFCISSVDKLYYGKLNKFCNQYLSYALVLRGAGATAIKGDNPLKKTYWRIAIKNHVNDVKIAVARQLARIIHSMLKHGQRWGPSRLAGKAVAATSIA